MPDDKLSELESAAVESALRSAMATAHDELPDASTMSRIEARLAHGIHGGGGPPAPRASLARVVVAVAAAGLLAGLGALMWGRTPTPHPPESPAEFTGAPTPPIAQPPIAADQRSAHETVRITTPAPSLPADLHMPRDHPREVRDRQRATPPAALAPSEPTPAVAPAAPVEPSDEIALIRAARRASLVDPGRALALAERHRREFAEGMLAEERETLAVEALAALSRRAEAEQRAYAFRARWPASPYRRRIDAALARP